MTCIDNDESCKLLIRALDILSIELDYELKLVIFKSGLVCIVAEDNNELMTIIMQNGSLASYFADCRTLLKNLLDPGTTMSVHIDRSMTLINVDFSKMFGSSIDELKLNLDLHCNVEKKPKRLRR